jgi:predicted ribosome quality control (RQC) complex YloA/Tae2 family protein
MNEVREEDFYTLKERRLCAACKKAFNHTAGKLVKQEIESTEALRWETYRQWADTLLSRPDGNAKGSVELDIENIHTRAVERITLNPKFNLRQNAELYYKKSRKGKRSLGIIEEKRNDTAGLLKKLELLLHECEESLQSTMPETDRILRMETLDHRLAELGFQPPDAPVLQLRETDGAGVAYRRYSFDGWNVFIGKTDSQNDELTTRFAKPWDIWMHVAGHAGSHVVIKRDRNSAWPPKEILVKAASLAVWFSKAKHTSYAEVHYTEARYVHKRRKSPPGEVCLQQHKTLRVSPVSPQVYFPGEYAA